MLNLSTLLDAQRVTWLVRSYKLPIDNWRFDLRNLSPSHNVLLVRESDVDKVQNPILHGIVKSFCKVNGVLSKNNLFDSQIFDNNAFKIPLTNTNLNIDFFGRDFYNRHQEGSGRSLLRNA
jgi:hypothetical protein